MLEKLLQITLFQEIYLGANFYSDHNPVVMKCKIKIKRIRNKEVAKISMLERLNNIKVRKKIARRYYRKT